MTDTLPKNQVLVLGLGGAGGRVVETLSQLPEAAGIKLSVFDTDQNALERLTLPDDDCKVLCDNQWLLGQGTGGDTIKGQRAMTRESHRLQGLISQASLLIVVGGLGGGTATGGAGVISRLARSMGNTAVFLFELPFAFEGHGRVKAAEDGLRGLLALSDTVLGIPNDLLFSVLPSEVSFADAFKMADMELARATLGLIDILRPGNLLSSDLGDLVSVLKNRKSYAAIGVGCGKSSDVGEACTQALANLLDSPFLGGAAKLKDADAVIINLTGGENLTLSEVKRTLASAGSLPGLSARVMIGANIRQDLTGEVHLTAIAVKYDEREAAVQLSQDAKSPTRRRREKTTHSGEQPVQQMLPLTITSSGIFEGKTPTIIDGVNFDIPAFVRNQVPVDTGE